jgi:hypothetical protein
VGHQKRYRWVPRLPLELYVRSKAVVHLRLFDATRQGWDFEPQ